MESTIKNVLEKKGNHVHGIGVDLPITDAVEKMKSLNVGSLLVFQDDRVVGIFTERDISRRVVFAGLDPEKTQVADAMTSPVAFVEPTSSIKEAMKFMSETNCRHLPVYENETLMGLVSLGDLLRQETDDLDAHARFLEAYIRGR